MSNGYPVELKTLIAGENATLNVIETINGVGDYESVAAGTVSPGAALGSFGAVNDYLHHLICVISGGTASQVQIKDGSAGAITVLPTGLTAPGFFVVPIGAKSRTGAWQIITEGNVSVIAVGAFS